MSSISKTLIIFGIILIAVGIVLQIVPKIPWLGKLPGDIYIKRGDFSFFFPISTCIIISVVVSLIFYLLGKR